MKKKVSRDLIIFIILIPVFLWGAFYISNVLGGNLPAYTVSNRSKMGYSVFFEVLKELNYPVERSTLDIEKERIESLQIVAAANGFDINRQEIKDWIKSGGILIYLTPGNAGHINYGEFLEEENNIVVKKYSKGKIIAVDEADITNKAIAKDNLNAYRLLKIIDEQKYKNIYFNENHFEAVSEQKGLWDYMSIEYKFIIYQGLILLIGYLYFRGKRFGKPISLYEEVERKGNEYLYSAAALYRQAKCWDLILDNYYKSFLKGINRSNEDWLDFWQEQGLPSFDKAKRLYDFMHRPQRKVKSKEYVQLIAIIEHLKSNWNIRRDSHWKTLKRTM